LRPQLDARAEFDACGTLWIAEDSTQLAALEEKRATYRSARVAADVIDARELRDAEPGLRDDLLGALLVPDDAVIYPPGATFGRSTSLVEWRDCREGVDVREIIANGVRCRGETLHADVVINAAGAAAPALTQGLPILPRKGHLAITDRYPDLCRHQIVELGYLTSAHAMTSESVAFNVQPRSTGQVLIGSSRELVGWDALNHTILARMLARAAQLMPGLRDVSVIRSWTGFRPATPDKLPLIGRWDAVPGVWIAGGHEGLGITMSLATGEIIADQIAGRAPQVDAAPFSPMRVLAQPHSGAIA
jgi:glycine/D-amino acid oxidase-like deaminating enzyme